MKHRRHDKHTHLKRASKLSAEMEHMSIGIVKHVQNLRVRRYPSACR